MMRTRLDFLTPENGFLFRITHIRNIPWILDHGLHCASAPVQDPDFVSIGNPDLIGKRAGRTVVGPGGTLSDYVPFYLTPLTPMLYNIKTGRNGTKVTPMPEITILVTSLPRIAAMGVRFLLADRHAFLATARFSDQVSSLAEVDWPRLQVSDFERRPDDPERFDRYQAEALVHRHLPVQNLNRIICYGADQMSLLSGQLASRGMAIDLAVEPGWYS